jgi:cell division protein FtsQ
VRSTGRPLRDIPSKLEMEDTGDGDMPRLEDLRPGRQRPDGPGLDRADRTGQGLDGTGLDGQGAGRTRHSERRPASAAWRVFLLLTVLFLLGGLTASSYLLKTYVGGDSRFRIAGASNIEATGLTEVSRAQMLQVFGEDIGRNIFFVPLSERRRQLEEIPWIERATVMRLLPDRIRVSVVERQPVAFTRQGQQIGLVDASGILLTMPAAMMAQHHYSFPVVTGIEASDSPAARKARMAVYQRLLAELDANGQHISEQISEIDLSDPADAQVLMPEPGADILAHFGEDRFLERYQRYKAHIAEWRQKYPKLAAVDLRYDQQVVLQMTPGASVAQAAEEEQNAASAEDGKTADEQVAGDAQGAGAAPEKRASGAKKAAEKSGVSGEIGEKRPSSDKQIAQKRPALKGHDFSRAVSAPISTGALAPEGRSSPASLESQTLSGHAKSAKPDAKGMTGQKNASARKNAKAPKAAVTKAKLSQENKKRAEAKRAALNLSRQKAAPTNRPAAAAAMGQ